MHLALQQQQLLGTNQLPFTVAPFHRQTEDLQAAMAMAARGGWTDAESLSHLITAPQPHQGIEGLQHV
jgi:hypothetical protein